MSKELIECFGHNVIVVLSSGKEATGYFSDYFSEYDNDGPATIFVGKWEIEVNDIKSIKIIEDTKK